MKKILLLLAMIFCSLIIGAEEIREGYCEGRGEILEKDFDYPDLSIVTTYDTCVINDVEYSNIKVERILRSYNENATLGIRENYPGNSDYCVVENDEGDGLQIYHSNAGCE
ncbi:hypothetical protein [Leptotrichia buccalis]|jgi:hypothetical protein|uniref:Uncharacterized protein n=1 Tax=Leptotrichia buccalis (strain ATCC 14201 / DSM 1135 / JCM 12969 / NCTC 10249 / C-1013-b) TaxID=523794 RepID=C7NAC0_LEPBD|nr:hypothetical protein [Leptotrichia buccalis]ACV39101.1 hypothetical protein Lebu_1210 [Leptotrichia buccalis C-1013-b]